MIVLSEAGGLPHYDAEAEVLRLVKVAAVPVQPTAYIVRGEGRERMLKYGYNHPDLDPVDLELCRIRFPLNLEKKPNDLYGQIRDGFGGNYG